MIATPFLDLLHLAWPELFLDITALVVVALDLLVLRRRSVALRFSFAAAFTALGCAIAIIAILTRPIDGGVFGGILVGSPLIRTVQVLILLVTIACALISTRSDFTEHVGEFFLLLLLATEGALTLVATTDLLVIFVSLELLSLSLYAMAAADKRSKRAAEAGLKYFLFGGMSAAFLLFGFSLLYGATGSTSLPVIASSLHTLTPLVAIAIVMTAIGFGFKVAAAPLHFWAPDVYQSAPAPAAAFIASVSKIASFFVFFELLHAALGPVAGSAAWGHFGAGWSPVIAVLAACSMVLGNLTALVQTSVRRLLAYSAIAHAGYMLVAMIAGTPESLAALLYYVFTYALTTVGIFALVAIVERNVGSDSLSSFNGLVRRAPFLAICLFIFFLSLAGIPPLSGFFAKFFLFTAALASPGGLGLLWLVILAIAMSAVSLFYYLQVLKRAFVTPAEEGAPEFEVPWFTQAVIGVLALLTLLFGCAPNLLLSWFEHMM
ncbi:NADH dehydrogenase subunit N [Bryocella elongata]|uniref:NADH-quinone oxidoreductase subunit N n=1 Tax=Bryocella elongata TaxID=863522 RepID=A0A1H5VVP0_9BACT|nr:NADH-quinone oxidoreductase subunit N [Bryocella elongata]SEF91270.1 NADH dehydrogenase subunit N [Bryocella elongata]